MICIIMTRVDTRWTNYITMSSNYLFISDVVKIILFFTKRKSPADYFIQSLVGVLLIQNKLDNVRRPL